MDQFASSSVFHVAPLLFNYETPLLRFMVMYASARDYVRLCLQSCNVVDEQF